MYLPVFFVPQLFAADVHAPPIGSSAGFVAEHFAAEHTSLSNIS
jgi:hypothetical protein